MEIDEQEYPPSLGLFDTSDAGFPFTPEVVQHLERRRGLLSDELIFDKLLLGGGCNDARTLYPPTSVDGLGRLLAAIEGTSYDSLKLDCLLYYLLRFHGGDDADNRIGSFPNTRSIPPQFVMLADAYWELDTGENVARAVSTLSDPRLNRDFTSKILQAISTPVESDNYQPYFPRTNVPNVTKTAHLIVRYIHMAKPLLVEPADLRLYIIALAEGQSGSPGFGITQAWRYQRTFPEHSQTRGELIRMLLDWCFTPYDVEDQQSLVRDGALRALLSIPFTASERSLVHAHAISPPSYYSPAAVSALRDLVIVRLISAGSYVSAIRLDARMALSIPAAGSGGSYAQAARSHAGPREAERGAKARRTLLADVLSALPPAERAILEDEATQAASKEAPDLSMSWADISAADLSAVAESWEELPNRPRTSNISAKISKNPDAISARSIAEVSGAPRFGLGIPPPGPRSAGPPNAFGTPSRPAPGSVSATPHAASTPARQSFRSNANQLPNAFFQPPVDTPPASQPMEEVEELGQPDVTGAGADAEEMDVDDSHGISVESNVNVNDNDQGEVDAESDAPEYSFSVFSGGPAPAPEAESSNTGRRKWLPRTETERLLPPGAYFATPEPSMQSQPQSEAEVEPAPSTNGHARSAAAESATPARRRTRPATSSPASPKPPAKRERRRADQTRTAANETGDVSISSSRRRLPGALSMPGDDDTNDSEDVDDVGPLPSSLRTSTRSHRAAAVAGPSAAGTISESEDDVSVRARGPVTRRRSSRLSVVGTEEPVSKRKPRSSTATNGKKENSKRKK